MNDILFASVPGFSYTFADIPEIMEFSLTFNWFFLFLFWSSYIY